MNWRKEMGKWIKALVILLIVLFCPLIFIYIGLGIGAIMLFMMLIVGIISFIVIKIKNSEVTSSIENSGVTSDTTIHKGPELPPFPFKVKIKYDPTFVYDNERCTRTLHTGEEITVVKYSESEAGDEWYELDTGEFVLKKCTILDNENDQNNENNDIPIILP